MNSLFNEEQFDRHTPLVDQKLYVISDFETRLETVVEYAAFNEQYVKLNGFEEVAFWQALKTPYTVKVNIPNLNIRRGPGVNYGRTGYFTGVGIFTIVDVKTGDGSKAGWGKLKSGAGWISLDYATKV